MAPEPSLGIGSVLVALLCFTNLPFLAAAQQKRAAQSDVALDVARGKSTWVETSHESDNSNNNNDNNKNNKNYKALQSSDVRALATLAPAGLQDRAVRAPPARSAGPSGGLSSRLPARSLQDWDVQDIVLLATVDGTIHARDRLTGGSLWTFEADRPMVETTYHQRNKSEGGTGAFKEDFLWIVEPSQDGSLYGYTPGSPFGMQYLGLTVKQLVEDLSPYAAEDPPVVYTGEKKNTLYTVDVASGNILQTFSSGGSFSMNQSSCRKVNELEDLDDDNKCGVSGMLTLGRTEYVVSIASRYTGEPICTINYFEWVPNNRDRDLYNQYSETMDQRYIYSRYDGRITAFDHLYDKNAGPSDFSRKPMYNYKFGSPVARVFDVARPRNAAVESPLIILPQPVGPKNAEDAFLDDEARVFVNCTKGGSWYALSENRYPMITEGAFPAQCSREDWVYKVQAMESSGEEQLKKFLVGVHALSFQGTFPKDVPLISAPDDTRAVVDPHMSQDHQIMAVLPSPGTSLFTSFTYGQVVLVLFLICVSLVAARLWPKAPLAPLPDTTTSVSVEGPAALEFEAISQPATTTEVETVPAFRIETNPLPVDVSRTPVTDEQVLNLNDVSSNEPVKSVRFEELIDVDTVKPAQVDGTTESLMERIKDESPSELGMDIDPVDQVAPKKKKAHRGLRGGTKKRRNGSSVDTISVVDSIVEGAKQIGQDIEIRPDAVNTSSSIKPDSSVVQNLIIHTKKVLGTGSGGTFVFEGEFEGRKVAVKRMLPQHFELAAKEVTLLEQSEDHPNVIRYFCRRQDEHFLYIALELCQASLWDLFRDGHNDEPANKQHAELVKQITNNPTRILRQMTEGLKYLHSFRIVHRDIKPHNMLLAYPKKMNVAAPLNAGPRLVISDFGLCKTLPDGGSTILGTTGNAGTAGWKAPELITQPKDTSNMSASRDSSTGDPNAPVSVLGIKRAVDIFSLGCAFFYVLTRGQHPFDDDEGWMQLREVNIKMNLPKNMHAISLFGPETLDLITWMLSPRPEDRPTAAQVLAHPFFWTAEDRLEFLSLASDRFDQEARDGTSLALADLESHAKAIIPVASTSSALTFASAAAYHRSESPAAVPGPAEPDFLSALDRKFTDTLGRQRKYNGARLADLLRALRNKYHHWDDMPDDVKFKVGEVPDGYLRYWENKFPGLVVGVWRSVRGLGWGEERRWARWFGSKEME